METLDNNQFNNINNELGTNLNHVPPLEKQDIPHFTIQENQLDTNNWINKIQQSHKDVTQPQSVEKIVGELQKNTNNVFSSQHISSAIHALKDLAFNQESKSQFVIIASHILQAFPGEFHSTSINPNITDSQQSKLLQKFEYLLEKRQRENLSLRKLHQKLEEFDFENQILPVEFFINLKNILNITQAENSNENLVKLFVYLKRHFITYFPELRNISPNDKNLFYIIRQALQDTINNTKENVCKNDSQFFEISKIYEDFAESKGVINGILLNLQNISKESNTQLSPELKLYAVIHEYKQFLIDNIVAKEKQLEDLQKRKKSIPVTLSKEITSKKEYLAVLENNLSVISQLPIEKLDTLHDFFAAFETVIHNYKEAKTQCLLNAFQPDKTSDKYSKTIFFNYDKLSGNEQDAFLQKLYFLGIIDKHETEREYSSQKSICYKLEKALFSRRLWDNEIQTIFKDPSANYKCNVNLDDFWVLIRASLPMSSNPSTLKFKYYNQNSVAQKIIILDILQQTIKAENLERSSYYITSVVEQTLKNVFNIKNGKKLLKNPEGLQQTLQGLSNSLQRKLLHFENFYQNAIQQQNFSSENIAPEDEDSAIEYFLAKGYIQKEDAEKLKMQGVSEESVFLIYNQYHSPEYTDAVYADQQKAIDAADRFERLMIQTPNKTKAVRESREDEKGITYKNILSQLTLDYIQGKSLALKKQPTLEDFIAFSEVCDANSIVQKKVLLIVAKSLLVNLNNRYHKLKVKNDTHFKEYTRLAQAVYLVLENDFPELKKVVTPFIQTLGLKKNERKKVFPKVIPKFEKAFNDILTQEGHGVKSSKSTDSLYSQKINDFQNRLESILNNTTTPRTLRFGLRSDPQFYQYLVDGGYITVQSQALFNSIRPTKNLINEHIQEKLNFRFQQITQAIFENKPFNFTTRFEKIQYVKHIYSTNHITKEAYKKLLKKTPLFDIAKAVNPRYSQSVSNSKENILDYLKNPTNTNVIKLLDFLQNIDHSKISENQNILQEIFKNPQFCESERNVQYLTAAMEYFQKSVSSITFSELRAQRSHKKAGKSISKETLHKTLSDEILAVATACESENAQERLQAFQQCEKHIHQLANSVNAKGWKHIQEFFAEVQTRSIKTKLDSFDFAYRSFMGSALDTFTEVKKSIFRKKARKTVEPNQPKLMFHTFMNNVRNNALGLQKVTFEDLQIFVTEMTTKLELQNTTKKGKAVIQFLREKLDEEVAQKIISPKQKTLLLFVYAALFTAPSLLAEDNKISEYQKQLNKLKDNIEKNVNYSQFGIPDKQNKVKLQSLTNKIKVLEGRVRSRQTSQEERTKILKEIPTIRKERDAIVNKTFERINQINNFLSYLLKAQGINKGENSEEAHAELFKKINNQLQNKNYSSHEAWTNGISSTLLNLLGLDNQFDHNDFDPDGDTVPNIQEILNGTSLSVHNDVKNINSDEAKLRVAKNLQEKLYAIVRLNFNDENEDLESIKAYLQSFITLFTEYKNYSFENQEDFISDIINEINRYIDESDFFETYADHIQKIQELKTTLEELKGETEFNEIDNIIDDIQEETQQGEGELTEEEIDAALEEADNNNDTDATWGEPDEVTNESEKPNEPEDSNAPPPETKSSPKKLSDYPKLEALLQNADIEKLHEWCKAHQEDFSNDTFKNTDVLLALTKIAKSCVYPYVKHISDSQVIFSYDSFSNDIVLTEVNNNFKIVLYADSSVDLVDKDQNAHTQLDISDLKTKFIFNPQKQTFTRKKQPDSTQQTGENKETIEDSTKKNTSAEQKNTTEVNVQPKKTQQKELQTSIQKNTIAKILEKKDTQAVFTWVKENHNKLGQDFAKTEIANQVKTYLLEVLSKHIPNIENSGLIIEKFSILDDLNWFYLANYEDTPFNISIYNDGTIEIHDSNGTFHSFKSLKDITGLTFDSDSGLTKKSEQNIAPDTATPEEAIESKINGDKKLKDYPELQKALKNTNIDAIFRWFEKNLVNLEEESEVSRAIAKSLQNYIAQYMPGVSDSEVTFSYDDWSSPPILVLKEKQDRFRIGIKKDKKVYICDDQDNDRDNWDEWDDLSMTELQTNFTFDSKKQTFVEKINENATEQKANQEIQKTSESKNGVKVEQKNIAKNIVDTAKKAVNTQPKQATTPKENGKKQNVHLMKRRLFTSELPDNPDYNLERLKDELQAFKEFATFYDSKAQVENYNSPHNFTVTVANFIYAIEQYAKYAASDKVSQDQIDAMKQEAYDIAKGMPLYTVKTVITQGNKDFLKAHKYAASKIHGKRFNTKKVQEKYKGESNQNTPPKLTFLTKKKSSTRNIAQQNEPTSTYSPDTIPNDIEFVESKLGGFRTPHKNNPEKNFEALNTEFDTLSDFIQGTKERQLKPKETIYLANTLSKISTFAVHSQKGEHKKDAFIVLSKTYEELQKVQIQDPKLEKGKVKTPLQEAIIYIQQCISDFETFYNSYSPEGIVKQQQAEKEKQEIAKQQAEERQKAQVEKANQQAAEKQKYINLQKRLNTEISLLRKGKISRTQIARNNEKRFEQIDREMHSYLHTYVALGEAFGLKTYDEIVNNIEHKSDGVIKVVNNKITLEGNFLELQIGNPAQKISFKMGESQNLIDFLQNILDAHVLKDGETKVKGYVFEKNNGSRVQLTLTQKQLFELSQLQRGLRATSYSLQNNYDNRILIQSIQNHTENKEDQYFLQFYKNRLGLLSSINKKLQQYDNLGDLLMSQLQTLAQKIDNMRYSIKENSVGDFESWQNRDAKQAYEFFTNVNETNANKKSTYKMAENFIERVDTEFFKTEEGLKALNKMYIKLREYKSLNPLLKKLKNDIFVHIQKTPFRECSEIINHLTLGYAAENHILKMITRAYSNDDMKHAFTFHSHKHESVELFEGAINRLFGRSMRIMSPERMQKAVNYIAFPTISGKHQDILKKERKIKSIYSQFCMLSTGDKIEQLDKNLQIEISKLHQHMKEFTKLSNMRTHFPNRYISQKYELQNKKQQKVQEREWERFEININRQIALQKHFLEKEIKRLKKHPNKNVQRQAKGIEYIFEMQQLRDTPSHNPEFYLRWMHKGLGLQENVYDYYEKADYFTNQFKKSVQPSAHLPVIQECFNIIDSIDSGDISIEKGYSLALGMYEKIGKVFKTKSTERIYAKFMHAIQAYVNNLPVNLQLSKSSVTKNPDSFIALYQYGVDLLNNGDANGAIEVLQKALSLQYNDFQKPATPEQKADIYVRIAKAQIFAKNLPAAKFAYNKAQAYGLSKSFENKSFEQFALDTDLQLTAKDSLNRAVNRHNKRFAAEPKSYVNLSSSRAEDRSYLILKDWGISFEEIHNEILSKIHRSDDVLTYEEYCEKVKQLKEYKKNASYNEYEIDTLTRELLNHEAKSKAYKEIGKLQLFCIYKLAYEMGDQRALEEHSVYRKMQKTEQRKVMPREFTEEMFNYLMHNPTKQTGWVKALQHGLVMLAEMSPNRDFFANPAVESIIQRFAPGEHNADKIMLKTLFGTDSLENLSVKQLRKIIKHNNGKSWHENQTTSLEMFTQPLIEQAKILAERKSINTQGTKDLWDNTKNSATFVDTQGNIVVIEKKNFKKLTKSQQAKVENVMNFGFGAVLSPDLSCHAVGVGVQKPLVQMKLLGGDFSLSANAGYAYSSTNGNLYHGGAVGVRAVLDFGKLLKNSWDRVEELSAFAEGTTFGIRAGVKASVRANAKWDVNAEAFYQQFYTGGGTPGVAVGVQKRLLRVLQNWQEEGIYQEIMQGFNVNTFLDNQLVPVIEKLQKIYPNFAKDIAEYETLHSQLLTGKKDGIQLNNREKHAIAKKFLGKVLKNLIYQYVGKAGKNLRGHHAKTGENSYVASEEDLRGTFQGILAIWSLALPIFGDSLEQDPFGIGIGALFKIDDVNSQYVQIEKRDLLNAFKKAVKDNPPHGGCTTPISRVTQKELVNTIFGIDANAEYDKDTGITWVKYKSKKILIDQNVLDQNGIQIIVKLNACGTYDIGFATKKDGGMIQDINVLNAAVQNTKVFAFQGKWRGGDKPGTYSARNNTPELFAKGGLEFNFNEKGECVSGHAFAKDTPEQDLIGWIGPKPENTNYAPTKKVPTRIKVLKAIPNMIGTALKKTAGIGEHIFKDTLWRGSFNDCDELEIMSKAMKNIHTYEEGMKFGKLGKQGNIYHQIHNVEKTPVMVAAQPKIDRHIVQLLTALAFAIDKVDADDNNNNNNDGAPQGDQGQNETPPAGNGNNQGGNGQAETNGIIGNRDQVEIN